MTEQTNLVTLTYLTNPLYQNGITKTDELNEIDQNEKRFYKRRILALIREMLRGEYPSDILKKIHNNYIIEIISHFKMTDKSDIIQDEYTDNICGIKDLDCPSSSAMTIDEANKNIGIKIEKRSTLDNFISVKKINAPAKKMMPKMKEYDLKNPKLKRKGVKKKIAKDLIAKDLITKDLITKDLITKDLITNNDNISNFQKE